jgi:hypothetical protein
MCAIPHDSYKTCAYLPGLRVVVRRQPPRLGHELLERPQRLVGPLRIGAVVRDAEQLGRRHPHDCAPVSHAQDAPRARAPFIPARFALSTPGRASSNTSPRARSPSSAGVGAGPPPP